MAAIPKNDLRNCSIQFLHHCQLLLSFVNFQKYTKKMTKLGFMGLVDKQKSSPLNVDILSVLPSFFKIGRIEGCKIYIEPILHMPYIRHLSDFYEHFCLPFYVPEIAKIGFFK